MSDYDFFIYHFKIVKEKNKNIKENMILTNICDLLFLFYFIGLLNYCTQQYICMLVCSKR